MTAVKPRYNSPSRLPHSKLAFDGTPQTGSRRPVSSNGLLFRRDDSPWCCPAHWKSRRNSRLSLLDLPFEEMVNHGCQDADMTLRLYPILQDELRVRELTNQFFNHSMQLLMRLGRLESEGISIDESELDVIRRNLLERAVALKCKVCEMLGKPFDLDSGTELTAILVQAFGLRPHFGSRTVTLSQLEQLAVSEPRVRKIVEYKRLRSQITAVDSISTASSGGRIYPLFSQVRSPAGFVTTLRARKTISVTH